MTTMVLYDQNIIVQGNDLNLRNDGHHASLLNLFSEKERNYDS